MAAAPRPWRQRSPSWWEPACDPGAPGWDTGTDSGDGSGKQDGAVHLLDAQGAQGARRQGHPRRRHAGVPARREDRRGRPERRRQVQRAQDHGRAGHRRPTATRCSTPGYSVGILLQEPPLDETKDVRGNVEEAVAETRAVLAAVRGDLRSRWPSRTPTSTRCWPSRASCMEKIEHRNGWELDSRHRAGDGRAALPAAATPTSRRCPAASGAGSRCARCCSSSPTCCCSTSPPTTSTPRASHWLEQHLAKYPGTVLAVTHDRYFLDNVAEWILELDRGRALPVRGQLLDLPRDQAVPAQGRGAQGRQAPAHPRAGAGVGARPTRRRARRRARRACSGTRSWPPRPSKTRKLDFEEIQIPPGPRLGTWWSRRPPHQGLRRPGADRRPVLHAAARRHRRHHRSRTASARPRCSRCRRRGEARRRRRCDVGETVDIVLRRPVPRPASTRRRPCGRSSPTGSTTSRSATPRCRRRAYVAAFGFKGPDQQKPTGVLSGGERNRLNLALTLKEGGNLLLLDEPTNDLDVETLQSLENALLEFPGCAVVISHDRWFLDRVATHILAWEGDRRGPGAVVLVRGQLRRLRGEQGRAPRRRRRPPAPGHLPQAHPRLS